jgi:hypothetical protein
VTVKVEVLRGWPKKSDEEKLPTWRLGFAGAMIALVVLTWFKLGIDGQFFNPSVALAGSGLIVLATSEILTLCIPKTDLTHFAFRLVTGGLGIAAVFAHVMP